MAMQIPVLNTEQVSNLQAQRPDLFDLMTDGYAVLRTDSSDGSLFLSCGDSVGSELQNLDPNEPKARLMPYAATVRWTTEQKGVWYQTYPLKTDADSQRKTSMLAADFRNGVQTGTINFKLADRTFVVTDSTLAQAFSAAIQGHLQNCYSIENDCVNKINSGAYTQTSDIDNAFAAIPVLPSSMWPPY